MKFIVVKCGNHDVADKYTQIVIQAAERAGLKVEYCDSLKDAFSCDQKALYYVGTVVEALKLWIHNRRNIAVWIQGVLPEESRKRNGSVIREIVLSKIERFIIKRAKLVLYVSKELKRHYIEKYSASTENRDYIMPCYSDEYNIINSDTNANRYSSHSFCYVGSLAKWQGFDLTVKIYKNVEAQIEDAVLYVFTSQIEQAKEKLKQSGIKRYEVGYYSHEELAKHLNEIRYGFLLRDKDIINWVSTPTKMSTYLANGVIPIYTEEVAFFKEIMKDIDSKVCVPYDEKKATALVLSHVTEPIIAERIGKEYKTLFDTVYNSEMHIIELTKIFKKLMR